MTPMQKQGKAVTVTVPSTGIYIPLISAPRGMAYQIRLYVTGAVDIAWEEGADEAGATIASFGAGVAMPSGTCETFTLNGPSRSIFVLPKGGSVSEVNVFVGIGI